MTRWALGVEYDGSQYHGFQQQAHSPNTIQSHLTAALSYVADRPLQLVCAGRTDAGVHATQQVIHFDALKTRSESAWVRGANSRLPETVRVHWARPVDDEFHARFSAIRRRYWYLIANTPVAPALAHNLVVIVPESLDEVAMAAGAQAFLGEQDFTSFRGAGCQSKTPMRNVYECSVRRQHGLIIIEVCANAFLLHMVRNMVGSLLAIGRGLQPSAWIAALMRARDRRLAAPTAPAKGLYLVEVDYGNVGVALGLPSHLRAPWFASRPFD